MYFSPSRYDACKLPETLLVFHLKLAPPPADNPGAAATGALTVSATAKVSLSVTNDEQG